MESEQVVVIDTDYGAQIYANIDPIPVVYIDLRRWADETPTRAELDKLKIKTEFITHPSARSFLFQWIEENEEYLEDLARPNDIEIQNAKDLLTRNGYEVTP